MRGIVTIAGVRQFELLPSPGQDGIRRTLLTKSLSQSKDAQFMIGSFEPRRNAHEVIFSTQLSKLSRSAEHAF